MIDTWPGWISEKLLGEGSFGKVYEIRREEFGTTYKAALKVITIPQNPADIEASYKDGMDQESITAYYRSVVEDIVAEFALMSQLKGNSNIVSYEDHQVVPHEDGIGWDILIRMELLKPLMDVHAESPLDEKEVTKLGIDLCHALELCEKKGIIHRDIKPDNIFVSEHGDYKLGDFGIARVIEKTTLGLSKKGTYNYMAPEVYRGDAYGFSVDIYSLGIVMYRFLNGNRTPFLPPTSTAIKYSDKESALARRMQGEELPEPSTGSERLIQIIRKACAFHPEQRYQKAEDMRHDLEQLLHASNAVNMNAGEEDTSLGQSKKEKAEKTATKKETTQTVKTGVNVQKKNVGKRIAMIAACVVVVVILAIAGTIAGFVRKATRGEREVVAMLNREVDTSATQERKELIEQFDQRLVGSWACCGVENNGDFYLTVPNNEMYIFPTGEFYTDWITDYYIYAQSEKGFPRMETNDGYMNYYEALEQAGNPGKEHVLDKVLDEYANVTNLRVSYEFYELDEDEISAGDKAVMYANETENDGLRMHITGEYSENSLEVKNIDMVVSWKRLYDREGFRMSQDMTGTWKDDSGLRWAVLYNPYSDKVKQWLVVGEPDGSLIKGDSWHINYELNEAATNGVWVLRLKMEESNYVNYTIQSYDGMKLVIVDENETSRTLERE